MRSGANSVQHLLTPAALDVLKHAVTEARRRGHPQVQPLHVVSMLLTHAESRLRQACMLSHPHNSQAAECRALEVCFNVALDHLPQSALAATSQPILSNALMAALKRAHAHQRRGCPEHQQSPLLAVKVEIDQLIISILDDPSVSRVMKEAGFSSTNVKFNLEDGPSTVTVANGVEHLINGHVTIGSGQLPNGSEQASKHGSFYDNSCMTHEENETKTSAKLSSGVMNQANSMGSWQQSDASIGSHERRELAIKTPNSSNRLVGPGASLPLRDEDVLNILEIFLKPKNRNVILVGDTMAANNVSSNLALKIKHGNVPAQLQCLQFLDPQLSSSSFGYCSSLEIEQKLAELSKIVEECMPAGAILHIGDLQWLAEPMQLKKGPSNFCPAQRTASELCQLLIRHASNRLWFIGVATPQIFARLQVLHPSLLADWGLQPVQISAVSQPNLLSRFANNTQLMHDLSTVHSLSARGGSIMDARHVSNMGATDRLQCCTDCVAKLEAERHLIHEHESLSLQLSLTGDKASPGGVNGGMGQLKKQSVAQQLVQLGQKWQKTCRMLHGDPPPIPVLTRSKPQPPSPSSRLSASSHGNLSKPCDLDLDISSRWSGLENRQLASCAVDQPFRTSPSFIMNNSRQSIVGSLQGVVEVQDAAALGADKSSDAPDEPDLGSPNDGSSVDSAPDDPEGPQGSTGTSAQIAFLAPIHTNLALGRANDAFLMAGKLRAPISLAMKPSPLHAAGLGPGAGTGASTISLKNNSKPHWLLQSPLHQRRAALNSTPRPGGLCGLSSASPLARRLTRLSKSPSPPPVALKEVVDDPTLKGLYKGLMQRVPWQSGAVAGIAATIMKCRSGMGNFRGATAKTDTWLLLLGPDSVAKVAIAKALAEMVFGGERSLIHLGFADGSPARLETDDFRMRGKTPLDRLVEAVRMKPSSVLLLEDIDKATSVFRNSIVRAMERGKLADSSMREVSVSNTIVVMTSSVGSEEYELEKNSENFTFSEAKLAAMGRIDVRARIKNESSGKVVFKGHNDKFFVVDHSELHPNESIGTSFSQMEVPTWVSKRKSDSWFPGQFRPKVEVKRTKPPEGRFLNLDLNLAAGESKCNCAVKTDYHCANEFDDEVKREKVLEQARLMLSEKFCALPDYAVGLDSYDFNGLGMEILYKLCKSLEDHAPPEVGVEIDLRLLEYIISCVWRIPGGRNKFNAWIDDVFAMSISRALADISNYEGSVVEFVADLPEVKDAFEGVALPHSINFASTMAV
uniref:Clp R domain-containing protein n=1 Tax=Physcomitrium patens TaxID=3218 RepID=A0A7I4AUF5_PHYPA